MQANLSVDEPSPVYPWRRRAVALFKCAISVAILWWLFSQAVRENQFEQIFRSNPNWGGLLLAGIACLTAFLISFYRWMLFVRAIDLPFGFGDAVRIGFIGLFFNLFAFGVIGGDALRAYYVTRQVRHRVPEAIASVFLDRFVGLMTMCGVAAVAFLVWDPDPSIRESDGFAALRIVGIVAVVGAAGGVGLLLIGMAAPWLAKWRGVRRLTRIAVIGDVVDQLLNVVLVYRTRPGLIAFGVLLSIAVNFCFMLTIFLVASSLTDSHPGFADHFLIEPIAMVANAVPLPGGIGGMELALNYLYQTFQSSAEQDFGIAVAFGFRFLLLIISAWGAVVWFLHRREFRSAKGWNSAEDRERAGQPKQGLAEMVG